jgi:hypothetical protein
MTLLTISSSSCCVKLVLLMRFCAAPSPTSVLLAGSIRSMSKVPSVYWRTVVLYVGQVENPRSQCDLRTECVGVVRTSIRFSDANAKSTSRSGSSESDIPLEINARFTDETRRELKGVRTLSDRSVPNGCMKLKVLKAEKSMSGLALDETVGPEAHAANARESIPATIIFISYSKANQLLILTDI